MNWFLLAALFFLLSPGIVLTVPPCSKGILFSGQTGVAPAIVHSLLFVLVCCILLKYLKTPMYEGFNACHTQDTCNCQNTQNACNNPCSNPPSTPSQDSCRRPSPSCAPPTPKSSWW
jgi:hypothetical protein